MEKKNNSEFEENESFEGGFKIEFEDVYSDTSKAEAVVGLNDFSRNGKHYAKKKRGIAAWWANRKKWQKAVMITATSLVLVVAILIGVVLSVFDYNYKEITKDPENLGFENVLDENIVNVALFGIDTRDPNSFEGLSDSIMILSLNTVTNKVKIISVMRDTFVPIVNKSGRTYYAKINSAYKSGGPEMAIKTLNTNFGLDIAEYATVNFYGMADIINAVGGVEAELTAGEVKKSDGTQHSINGCIDEICHHLGLDPNDYHIFKPGVHTLNGVQAVAYSRIRYVANIWGTNNDYGRTDRQRHVMEQLFNKALTMKKSQYVTLAKSLIPCSQTSLSYSEIMGLAFDILLESPTFAQTRIPQQDWQMSQPSGVGSVVYYDLDFASKVIHSFIYDDITPEDYVAANGVDKNDWYRNKFGYSSGSGNSNTTDNNTSGGNTNDEKPAEKPEEKPEDNNEDKPTEKPEDEEVVEGPDGGDIEDPEEGNEEDKKPDGEEPSEDKPESGDTPEKDNTQTGGDSEGENKGEDNNNENNTPPDSADGATPASRSRIRR